MRSHIQTINYTVQVNDSVIRKVAIFNTNKLPTGVAIKCIESDTYNKYLLVLSEEQYNAIFLDDGDFDASKIGGEFEVFERSENE